MSTGQKRADLPQERDVMIGLEIHFQLKGLKLFCDCSTETYGVRGSSFERNLAATASEMGFYDPAAEYEKTRNRTFRYITTDNSCLVEADEEPPHMPNMEAIETGLKVAGALNCRTLDSVMFMRKIVVDGSNTSGFQRTSIVGLNGSIETGKGSVGISSVCVEEDSARKLEEENKEADVTYSLDRLGIPLLEIATDPEIVDADHAVEVARSIGYIVASTGKSRRQVDSIRQDVNISLGFGRVEIKGIQKLSLIGKAISHEIMRQRNMRDAMNELRKRGGLEKPIKFVEAGNHFKNSSSKMISKAFKEGKSVFCSTGSNLAGLLKKGDFRVGKDFSDIAKAFGLGGILHTDELPAFGITEEEVKGVVNEFSPGNKDALILIITVKEKADKLSDALNSRVEKLLKLDFSETRGPMEDGSTKFLRPLPGKERMYPETDIPVVEIDREARERIKSFVPRSEEEIAQSLSSEYSISVQDARTIASNFMVDEFRELESVARDGKLAARVMLQTVPEIERKYDASFQQTDLIRLLEISASAGWPRNTLEKAMDVMLGKRISAEDSAKQVSSMSISAEELKELVDEILKESNGTIRPGALISELKKRTEKSFDPKEAIEILSELQ